MHWQKSTGLLPYYVLACGITWLCAWPTASAWLQGRSPEPWALALAGLSALGPLLAAVTLGKIQGNVGAAFRPWRVSPGALFLALAIPSSLRVVSALVAGDPGEASWTERLFIPTAPERWAALVLFPLGEEFGWRGYAYPRLQSKLGTLPASLTLGLMWGFWHLAYSVNPSGQFDGFAFANGMVELPLYSIILSWIFERSGRSMAIPLVFHMTAHLFHIELAGAGNLTLQATHLGLLTLAAGLAAWGLHGVRPNLGSSGR